MRASVYQDDPGYPTWCEHRNLKVFFEGAEVLYVVTADEEKRFIVQLDRDEQGHFMLNEAKDGARMTTRYGHVRIEVGE